MKITGKGDYGVKYTTYTPFSSIKGNHDTEYCEEWFEKEYWPIDRVVDGELTELVVHMRYAWDAALYAASQNNNEEHLNPDFPDDENPWLINDDYGDLR